jgi:hypothetical protein
LAVEYLGQPKIPLTGLSLGDALQLVRKNNSSPDSPKLKGDNADKTRSEPSDVLSESAASFSEKEVLGNILNSHDHGVQ